MWHPRATNPVDLLPQQLRLSAELQRPWDVYPWNSKSQSFLILKLDIESNAGVEAIQEQRDGEVPDQSHGKVKEVPRKLGKNPPFLPQVLFEDVPSKRALVASSADRVRQRRSGPCLLRKPSRFTKIQTENPQAKTRDAIPTGNRFQ